MEITSSASAYVLQVDAQNDSKDGNNSKYSIGQFDDAVSANSNDSGAGDLSRDGSAEEGLKASDMCPKTDNVHVPESPAHENLPLTGAGVLPLDSKALEGTKVQTPDKSRELITGQNVNGEQISLANISNSTMPSISDTTVSSGNTTCEKSKTSVKHGVMQILSPEK